MGSVVRLTVDDGLVAFCGSSTRVATLGALASTEGSLSGYRVSKLTGIQPIKVYRELVRASKVGLVERAEGGFRLRDPDLRILLRKRVRIAWSKSWYDQEAARSERAQAVRRVSTRWFDPGRYRPNPAVVKRYESEIERPLEKDAAWPRRAAPVSRKRK